MSSDRNVFRKVIFESIRWWKHGSNPGRAAKKNPRINLPNPQLRTGLLL